MAYVNERADYYNLGVPGVDKLREIFLALLDDFSVSEIWYMISAAYMSAAAFIQSAKCTSNKHATNIIPSKIISLSEQPSHLVKKWSRIRQIPRCAMSEILFNVMLNDAQDAGFNLSPGRECAALIERQLSRQQTRRVNDAKHSPPSEQELNELISRYDVQTLRNCLNLLEQRRALIQKQ